MKVENKRPEPVVTLITGNTRGR